MTIVAMSCTQWWWVLRSGSVPTMTIQAFRWCLPGVGTFFAQISRDAFFPTLLLLCKVLLSRHMLGAIKVQRNVWPRLTLHLWVTDWPRRAFFRLSVQNVFYRPKDKQAPTIGVREIASRRRDTTRCNRHNSLGMGRERYTSWEFPNGWNNFNQFTVCFICRPWQIRRSPNFISRKVPSTAEVILGFVVLSWLG